MTVWIKKDVDPDALQIRWKWPNGYLDIIDSDEFTKQCINRLSWHECYLLNGKDRANAKFLKTVIGNSAILDYEHPNVLAVNKKNGMEIGRCRITFTDSKRAAVMDVTWIKPDNSELKNAASTSWGPPVPFPPFKALSNFR